MPTCASGTVPDTGGSDAILQIPSSNYYATALSGGDVALDYRVNNPGDVQAVGDVVLTLSGGPFSDTIVLRSVTLGPGQGINQSDVVNLNNDQIQPGGSVDVSMCIQMQNVRQV